jgi:MOSC domain-containing protein YiiM
MSLQDETAEAVVMSVGISGTHSFSKPPVARITLLAGLGAEGDAHLGETVKHRSRVARDPTQPNFRQVHLIHSELFEELAAKGFHVTPGDIGENVLTRGVDLLRLPEGTRLHIGTDAVVELTGLRNPCPQLDAFQAGLMSALVDKGPDGRIIRKAGVMAVVLEGGEIVPGDPIRITLPPEPHRPLEKI